VKEQGALLKTLVKALEGSPAAQDLAKRASKAVPALGEEAAERQKRLRAALERLTADLSAAADGKLEP
jgi:hypothetical protein